MSWHHGWQAITECARLASLITYQRTNYSQALHLACNYIRHKLREFVSCKRSHKNRGNVTLIGSKAQDILYFSDIIGIPGWRFLGTAVQRRPFALFSNMASHGYNGHCRIGHFRWKDEWSLHYVGHQAVTPEQTPGHWGQATRSGSWNCYSSVEISRGLAEQALVSSRRIAQEHVGRMLRAKTTVQHPPLLGPCAEAMLSSGHLCSGVWHNVLRKEKWHKRSSVFETCSKISATVDRRCWLRTQPSTFRKHANFPKHLKSAQQGITNPTRSKEQWKAFLYTFFRHICWI